MKKFLLSIIALLLMSSCTKEVVLQKVHDQLIDNRLIGVWKSDKDKTIEWLRKNRKYSEEKIQTITNKINLGTLVLKIDKEKTISIYEGESTELENSIVAIASNSIAMVVQSPLGENLEIRVIVLEDDKTFSTYIRGFDFKEYFKKIK